MDWPEFLVCEPILAWPGKGTPEWQRTHSRFKGRAGRSTPLSTTISELRFELEHLGAVRPVMRMALRPRDIRNDGHPRANARPEHPGIVLVFGREARSEAFESRSDARDYLYGFARAEGVTEGLTAQRLYRIASMATHPDKGGRPEDWAKVSEAHRLLTQDDSYQFACDRFLRWEDNLRAITKTLDALRAVDRYDVVQGGEQYAGFKQLTR